MEKGWIKLHRTLQDWEWYDDHNATRLLIHLLITVNYEDRKWKGHIIPSGSRITSWDVLSSETGLSKKQVRTAMLKLEKSEEVARKQVEKGQLVSLVKWDKLQASGQDEGTQQGRQRAGKGQDEGTQRAPTKEVKNNKNVKNVKKKEVIIPDDLEFLSYCRTVLLEKYSFYEFSLKAKYDQWKENDWRDGHNKPISNWKTKIRNTIPHLKMMNNGTGQPTSRTERVQADVDAQFERLAKDLHDSVQSDQGQHD